MVGEIKDGVSAPLLDGLGEWERAELRAERYDPVLGDAYRRFAAVGMDGTCLELRYKYLILTVINASISTLCLPAMMYNMQMALSSGATCEEVVEALELTSVIGMHSCSSGLPILREELAAAGHPVSENLNAEGLRVKNAFLAARGWWSDFLEAMVQLHPELLDAYVEYSAVPWAHGALAPKIKEFIYIAIDAQTTHIYEKGLREHIRNALRLGATAEEIVEVFALISPLGFHTMTFGIAALDALGKTDRVSP